MASVFGGGSSAPASAPPVPEAGLRVQTSLEGVVRPLVYGKTRIAGNLIWYGDFHAVAQVSNQGQQGGKGGLFSAPSTSTTTGYNYFASIELALCEGVISGIGQMWADKSLTDLGTANLGIFSGTASQSPWSFLTASFPGQDFAYRNTAYVAGNVSLGSTSSLPNWTFEVTGPVSDTVPGQPDCGPTEFLSDFLTNPNYGVAGWLSSYNGDWTQARNYLLASNLLISVALTTANSASAFLQELVTSLNLISTWSDGVLKLIPRGDTQISGNGVAYFPPTAPIYDLADDDFLPNQSAFGNTNADPISGQRKPPRLQNNIIKVEYLDRASNYNPAVAQSQDDGAILLFGERGSDSTSQWHWFQSATAAGHAADLALGRERIANNYTFTLRPRFILLDVGDIVTISDPGLSLERQWVRIMDIQENGDRSLNFLVEEYLQGTAAAPQFGREVNSGSVPNFNADPGGINDPIFFEPTDQLAGGLQVWAAVSGVNHALYGGSDAYVSYDGVNYARVPNGRQFGSARMGVLSAALAPVPVSAGTQTIDTTHTLRVDLTESAGELTSGSQADALALNTACWVDGEVVAYQIAALTAADKFDLTYLVRGAYGTEAQLVAHPAGSKFVRIDDGILKIPFDQTRIGATISLKFVPFNIFGVTVTTLAQVPAFTYVITGSALSSPLPTLQNLTTYFDQTTGTTQIGFDEITDFRSDVRYEIKLGATLDSALSLGTRAHPPFASYGDGTYWLSAVCQPIPGLFVHSEQWVSLTITGSTLVQNVIATRDEAASGWPGIASGDVSVSLPFITTTGGGSGTYTISPNHYIDAGRVAPCRVAITWLGSSQAVNSNILSVTDILADPDFLGASGINFVDIHPEISFSQTGAPGDVFALDPEANPGNDIFAEPDVFSENISFGPWQRYQPGVYVGRIFRARMVLTSSDANTAAIALAFKFSVDVPDRVDTWGIVGGVGQTLNQITVPATGLVIQFASNGRTIPEAFNGGPGTDAVPLIQITNTSATAFDFEVTGLTLSGCTIIPRIAGVPTTAPKTNISIQGW